MSNEQSGEKTEQPTPRRLEEAIKQGQFPRSAEVQTVFVLGSALLAIQFSGGEIWRQLAGAQVAILGHLHDIPLDQGALQSYLIQAALALGVCVLPVVAATTLAGLLAGGIQSRFQTSSEALSAKWDRLNPISGFQRIFSTRGMAQAGLSLLKLGVVLLLLYNEVHSLLADPIFYSAVDVARIAGFMANASLSIVFQAILALSLVAALDYTYQFWRTKLDLMMTKEEVKEEMKSSEGNPQVKARQRRRRNTKNMRKMLEEVPKADVVVTNPTHLAIALRYDRGAMKAPQIVAKGCRLNALRIREIAQKNGVPIIENKPLARLMFKHGRVGSEIPTQVYAAVAEILAWVYRVNRYRYYAEQNQATN